MKWIRVLFRCWKDRKPYRDAFYREALARHQRRRLLSLYSGVLILSRVIWWMVPIWGKILA
jgi:hypothetical protein